MSRPLRIQYSDAWYHVLNRGRRGEDIFQDDTDLKAFITVLREVSVLWNVKIAAYCLMANHYHQLLQTPDANLSRCMRHIDGVYTQRYNRQHAVDGPVFRGRYRSILVDGEAYPGRRRGLSWSTERSILVDGEVYPGRRRGLSWSTERPI
jgi:putative transposase